MTLKNELQQLDKSDLYRVLWYVRYKTALHKISQTKVQQIIIPVALLQIVTFVLLVTTSLYAFAIGDINLDNGEIYIRPHRSGIKSRPRTVYLGAKSRQAVWKYIAKRQAQKDTTQPLIELQGSSIRLLLRRIGKNAGVPHANPHKFRHTFAIFYLRNRGDVFTLQRLLGHSTLDMTKKYLDIVRDDLQDAHKYASPMDNL